MPDLKDRLDRVRKFANSSPERKAAARRGELGLKPVLPGYEIKSSSAQYNAQGEITGYSVKQVPSLGPEFELPAGHAVKGVSSLVSADGRVTQQCIKTSARGAAIASSIDS